MEKKNRKIFCGLLFVGALVGMIGLLFGIYAKSFYVQDTSLRVRLVQLPVQKPAAVMPPD